MKYISLFDDFSHIDEYYSFDNDSLLEAKLNQMSILREGCMASWDLNEFKTFFGPSLNESNSPEESELLLEKAYHTYELGVLYENRKEWFEDDSERIVYLNNTPGLEEGYSILFKGNKLHIVKESTINTVKEGIELITEGFFGAVGDFFSSAASSVASGVKSAVKAVGSAVNKYVVQPVKKAAAYVKDKVVKAWDALSKGAKAVWDFSKQIVSAVGAFIKENPLTAIGILLTIIGTILSFIPVVQFLAPICAMVAGALTVYEGVTNLITAGKEIGAAQKVGDIVKGGGKIVFGSASLVLGIRDIISSAADALPGMGSIGVAIKSSTIAWTQKFTATAFGSAASVGAGKVLGCSAWLGEFFVTLCQKAPFVTKNLDKLGSTGKVGNLVAKNAGTVADQGLEQGKGAVLDHEEYIAEWDQSINEAEGGDWSFGELLINFITYVGKSCFNWLYNAVVKGISMVGKAINGLMELPGRITKSIDRFKKDQGGSFIGGIISGALGTAVRPITSCAQKFIDGYIKPKFKPVTGWMTSLGKRNAQISKAIDGNKKLKSPEAALKEAGPAKIKKKEVQVTAKDKAAIKKIGTTGTATIVKAGGGSEKILEKIKKANAEFKKKFPGVAKEKGTFGQSPTGKATFTFMSKKAGGSVTLFNDGKYTVLTGPNKKARGEFKADKGVKLMDPKDGWKKNESRRYVLSINSFLG